MSVCQYVSQNKDADNDWFRLESNKDGTRWFGKCWYIHNLLKYEFNVEFDVSGSFFWWFLCKTRPAVDEVQCYMLDQLAVVSFCYFVNV